jgi:hypothetical protein
MLKLPKLLEILKKDNIPDITIQKIVKEIKADEELKKDNKNTDSKSKKEFVLLIDPKNPISGFAVQIEESEDAGKTLDKIREAILAYNNSRKGKKSPVKTIPEALNVIPRRFFVDVSLWVKTKESVRVVNL